MSMTRYLLSFAASVMLALPTGWCCLVTFTPAAAPASDCCSSCCPRPAAPCEEAPTRVPMTVCCCENNVSLPEDGPHKTSPDDGLSSPIVADVVPSIDRFCARPAALGLSPPRPLTILLCRWLC